MGRFLENLRAALTMHPDDYTIWLDNNVDRDWEVENTDRDWQVENTDRDF